MTDVETRLRSELPELADSLLGDGAAPSTGPADAGVEQLHLGGTTLERERGPAALLAVACVVLVAMVAGLVVWRDRDATTGDQASERTVVEEARAVSPRGPGTWRTMSPAPIAPRTDPVAGWVDGEVIVWAGESETDGAAYDPTSDSWRSLAVPGWTHPGLTGATFDERIVALAKGGLTAVDPGGGEWRELSGVDGVLLGRLVAAGDRLFGLGVIERPEGGFGLSIAGYDAVADEWTRGADLRTDLLVSWNELHDLDLAWTGQQIVVWDADGASAYDPALDEWSTLAPLLHPDGRIDTSVAAGSDAGLVIVAEVVESTGRTSYRTARSLSDGGWLWSPARLPTVDLDEVTIASAGDWVVMFEPELPPV
ncbi:MAG: hypothetical protein AAGA17_18725, partial [Actinomycetota bacterium]